MKKEDNKDKSESKKVVDTKKPKEKTVKKKENINELKKKTGSKKENKNKLSKEQVKNVKKKLKSVKPDVKSTYKPVTFSLVEVIVIILITGVVVSVCSGLIVFNNYDKLISNDSEENGKLSEFIESYNHIMSSYVEDVDGEALLDAAIGAMYNYLGDSYSGYIDESTSSDLQEQLNGKYEGLGVEITSDEEKITITKVFENSPAEEAGLQVGDVVLKIDGEDFKGKTAADMSNAIKNGDKDSFEITYLRDGKERSVVIKKDEIYINSVSGSVIEGVGYLQIETFSATTMEQVKQKLDEFDKDVKSLIVDVRNNSGGYLNSAYDTADLFVEKNKLIYKLKDNKGNITNYPAKNGVYRKFDDIVVLINEGSASASEILAAALSESANAKLIGEKSFGKGTVQDTQVLSSGAMIKYTSSYWLTPNGNSINNKGLTPDIEVKNDEIDNQLNKAVETLK